MDPILIAQGVSKRFGKGMRAVDDVTLGLQQGEIKGLIGPNGSGKTTFVNLLNGIHSCDTGEIYLRGERIDKLTSFQISCRGIGRTFQIVRVFGKMTVQENLHVAGHCVKHKDKLEIYTQTSDLLKLVGLHKLKDERAQNLSGGQQKLLELARTLMTDPEILLLDEPFAGVNPAVKKKLFDTIQGLNKAGLTCLVISHDLPSIVELCKNVAVLAAGRKIAEGETRSILKMDVVIQAYLGETHA